jgi:hypothetical protein
MVLPDKVLIALAAILPSEIEKPRVQLVSTLFENNRKSFFNYTSIDLLFC